MAPRARIASASACTSCPPPTTTGMSVAALTARDRLDGVGDIRQPLCPRRREQHQGRSPLLHPLLEKLGIHVGAQKVHPPASSPEQPHHHPQAKVVPLASHAGGHDHRSMRIRVSVPTRKLRNEVAGQLRNFLFLPNREVASFPARSNLIERRAQHISKESRPVASRGRRRSRITWAACARSPLPAAVKEPLGNTRGHRAHAAPPTARGSPPATGVPPATP